MNQYLESEKLDTQYIQNEYTMFDWNYKKILKWSKYSSSSSNGSGMTVQELHRKSMKDRLN